MCGIWLRFWVVCSAMEEKQNKKLALYEALDAIVESLACGVVRLSEARITSNAVFVEWAEHHLLKAEPAGSPSSEKPDSDGYLVKTVGRTELDGFKYVSNVTSLVYAATLLDTFLSDTMRLLFLHFPSSFPEDKPITWREILESETIQDVIVNAVNKRVRDISHDSFLSRISTLRKLFGLEIEFDEDITEQLRDYSDLRNVIVHDQAVFDISLDEHGEVKAAQKTCPRHPTPVSDEDLAIATTAFFRTISVVYSAVVEQVCGIEVDKKILQMINGFYLGTRKSS